MNQSRDQKWKEIYELFCNTNNKDWSVENLTASISVNSSIRDLIFVDDELMGKDSILLELMNCIAPSKNNNISEDEFNKKFEDFSSFLDLVISLRDNIEFDEIS